MGNFKTFKAYLLFALIMAAMSLGLSLDPIKYSQRCGDWKAYKDEKCFGLVSTAGFQNQGDAEVVCESFSEELKRESVPRLVTIKSKEEQDFLHQLLFIDDHTVDNVWLGLKEVGNSGVFEWNDGSPVEYSNWANQTATDEDHHCGQMTSGKEAFAAGQWVRVHCGKRNEVVCERMQTWSLETLQDMFLTNRIEMEREFALLKEENERQKQEHEKEIRSLKEETEKQMSSLKKENGRQIESLKKEMQQNPIPSGFIYVQLAGQLPPTALWPHTNWTDVTATYAGLFFRAGGGNAAPFGQIQDENTKRLEQIQMTRNAGNAIPISVPRDGTWSPTIHSGIYIGGYGWVYALSFRLSTGEVRPRNQAVRIWQRN